VTMLAGARQERMPLSCIGLDRKEGRRRIESKRKEGQAHEHGSDRALRSDFMGKAEPAILRHYTR
jgi:hypothetical protein